MEAVDLEGLVFDSLRLGDAPTPGSVDERAASIREREIEGWFRDLIGATDRADRLVRSRGWRIPQLSWRPLPIPLAACSLVVEIVGFGAAIWAVQLARDDLQLNRQALALNAQATRDATTFQAWQAITSAAGLREDGGRTRALEYLATAPGGVSDIEARSARLPNLRITDGWLRSARFDGSGLEHAVIRRSTFIGARFTGANLSFSRFDSCSFVGTDFGGATIIRTEFDDCTFDGCSWKGAFVRRGRLLSCTLCSDSSITSEQLRSFDDWGGSDLPAYLDHLETERGSDEALGMLGSPDPVDRMSGAPVQQQARTR